MKYLHQRITLYQKVATVFGIGKVFAINYDKRICDVVLADKVVTVSFEDLVKA